MPARITSYDPGFAIEGIVIVTELGLPTLTGLLMDTSHPEGLVVVDKVTISIHPAIAFTDILEVIVEVAPVFTESFDGLAVSEKSGCGVNVQSLGEPKPVVKS
jgi:hypothetical protein